jgi:release factor glutamine methyltransferase
LLAHPDIELTREQQQQFHDDVQRRCNNEPIAYIIGSWEFWSLTLNVTEATLIPRPETELLVESILALTDDDHSTFNVADLGTGSGAIALAIASERPNWHVFATDVSENALTTARHNAQQLGLNRVSFLQGSWCNALPCIDFDVIASNPPYIAETEWETYADGLRFEPRTALVSGQDGLDAIREISHAAKDYLKPGGYVIVEHGFLQGAAVRAIFATEGYNNIHSVLDLSGQERVTIGCKRVT